MTCWIPAVREALKGWFGFFTPEFERGEPGNRWFKGVGCVVVGTEGLNATEQLL